MNIAPSIDEVLCKRQHELDLVRYLHGSCFAPRVSTWVKAIKNGNFLSWPGLMEKLFLKHLPPSLHTGMGHLDQERTYLQSTNDGIKGNEALRQQLKYRIEKIWDKERLNTIDSPNVQKEIYEYFFP